MNDDERSKKCKDLKVRCSAVCLASDFIEFRILHFIQKMKENQEEHSREEKQDEKEQEALAELKMLMDDIDDILEQG